MFSVIKKRSRLSLPVTLIFRPLFPLLQPPSPNLLFVQFRAPGYVGPRVSEWSVPPPAATAGGGPEWCYWRGVLSASSSHRDFAKTVYFYVALERVPRSILSPFSTLVETHSVSESLSLSEVYVLLWPLSISSWEVVLVVEL